MIDIAAQIRCVEREIAQRKRVYARLLAEGKMKQEKADYEVSAMEAVLATLQTLPRTGELPL